MGTTGGSDVEAGFAKLQGEDFEYYMQTYSIMLGRNSKKSTVDVDLASLGGGMNISRHHARIFYDFARRRFALEVLGKNGCLVEGVLHLPGNPPVKLDSQDLLQIGDKEFYFLLPVRSILGGTLAPRHHVSAYHSAGAGAGAAAGGVPHHNYHGGTETGRAVGSAAVAAAAKKGRREYYEEEFVEEDDVVSGKKVRREEWYGGAEAGSGGKAGLAGALVPVEKKGEGRSRVDRESDNQQLMQLEEKDVVSSVATVLSDLCGPGEWMPMEKLHAELVEQFSNIWHHSRVRRYLTSEDYPGPESKGKPWYGLLMLLRKYPEHFVINTRSKGRITLEFVSLFKFHPTDEELIEFLLFKTIDPDFSVQFIDQVLDICELEPWELQGHSSLQSGDGLCYYIYSPKYKYRNSKLISRTTREGYWKPTGNIRKIFSTKTGEEIGSKKTLVFYKGHCNNNNKNKTCWVMHEYQIKPTDSDDHQKTFKLCKLKKKASISSSKAGQSNQQYSVSNIQKHEANNTITEDILHPNLSSEPEADGFNNQSSSIETYVVERSNKHNMFNEDEGSNFINHAVEDAIPKDDEYYCNSIVTNCDETVPKERSNQHDMVVVDEGFKLPSNLEYLVDGDLIPTELLYDNGLSLDELLAKPETTNNSNWIQNQHTITNTEDHGDNNEAYVQEGNTQGLLVPQNN